MITEHEMTFQAHCGEERDMNEVLFHVFLLLTHSVY